MNIKLLNKKGALYVILALFFSVTSVSGSAQALDETFYSGNDILYYDPEAICGASSAATDADLACGEGSFKFATYNVLGYNHPDSTAKSPYANPERMRHAGQLMLDQGVEVFVANEVIGASQRQDLLGGLTGWSATKHKSGNQDVLIYWDTSVYKAVKSGTFNLPVIGVRPQPWVQLQHKETKGKVYVFGAHLSLDRATQERSARMLVDNIKRIVGTSGVPFVLGGDMNSNDASKKWAYPIFKQSGIMKYTREEADQKFQDNCDTQHGAVADGQQCRRSRGSHIDHVWVSKSPDIKTKSYRVIASAESDKLSDHNPVVVDLAVPGLGGDCSNSSGASVNVTLAHANVVTGSKRADQPGRFRGTMQMFASDKPDFVTLNEINSGTNTNYKEYKSFKQDYPRARTSEDSALRILWNSDKWKKIGGDIELIHPFETLAGKSSRKDRYALWATFQHTSSGAVVSVIATHWNTRATFSPNHGRAKLQGENMAALAQKLLPSGPVLIGGDLNYRIGDQYLNKPYSPDTTLGKAGLKAVFKPADASNVDWIFYSDQLRNTQKKVLTSTGHLTDHPYLVAKFEGSGGSGAVAPGGGNCICSDPNASDPDGLAAPGGSNVSKSFSLGNDKSKRPVALLKQLMADFNFKDYQAAGIVGNFMHESGGAHLPPNVNEGGDAGPPKFSGGYGWAQWTGGRQTAFIDFAVANGFMASRNVSATDAANYAYLVHELTATSEKAAVSAVKATRDVSEAAAKFEEVFERAGVVANESRDNHARDVLNAYKNNTGVGASGIVNTESGQSCPNSNSPTGQSAKFGEVAFPLKGTKSVVKNPNIFNSGTTDRGGHPYIAYDIYANAGTKVLAFASGVVTAKHSSSSLGNGVSVYNEEAGLVVYYTHMASVSVSEGDRISPGDPLGTLASVSTYPDINTDHLHIDASTDRVRQACSRDSCPIQDHFRDIGKDLFNMYQKLPD